MNIRIVDVKNNSSELITNASVQPRGRYFRVTKNGCHRDYPYSRYDHFTEISDTDK